METLFRLFGYATPSLAEPKLNELLYALQISVDDSPYMVAHQTRYTVPAAIDVLSTCQLTPLNTENITIDDVNKAQVQVYGFRDGFDAIQMLIAYWRKAFRAGQSAQSGMTTAMMQKQCCWNMPNQVERNG